MIKIKCPHCKQEIDLDKSDYDALMAEIRTDTFNSELEARLKEREALLEKSFQLKSSEAEHKQDSEINDLKQKIALLEQEKKSASKDIELAVAKAVESSKEDIRNKDIEINKLKSDLDASRQEIKNKEIEFNNTLKNTIQLKDADIERYKNHAIGNSTKDIGESLEIWCHNEFDAIRMNSYPNCYFEKDNEVIKGSKGDFVFKDYVDGIEILSIMFEMKNQNEETDEKIKHKNEDFFKKLDEDRNNKGLEYAILVSTLEENSNLYNKGIVDVSYKYPKMFVVRPQFFLAIIGILKSLALNTYKDKKELVEYKSYNADIVAFENELMKFKDDVFYNTNLQSKKYEETIKELDKTISSLTKAKEALESSLKNMNIANNKIQEITLRKLTKNSPSIQEEYKQIKKENK